MPIRERYQGKRILITGTTGFLGKVLLEKFLYSLSCVDKIYVLIRTKEGSNLLERFKKEIVSSRCFDRIRLQHKGRFDEFIQQKVQPIQGDLQKEGLGLSKQILEELRSSCDVIINCAASIDFNARIDFAIDSNIYGSCRMLELARSIKNLSVFTHISTCYVNCDQRGLIKEEIYDKELEPEEELRQLMSLPLNELIANTKKILGKYPNTYTYTKSLCERLLKKRQGGVPLCIVRPAIINTSIAEPFPGWIDSIAAAAALFMFIGLGIVHEIKGNPKKIGDTIPVDVVVATTIIASAFNFGNKSLPIYHVGSSDRNPLTWGQIATTVQEYWNKNASPSRVANATLLVTQNQSKINMNKFRRMIPIQAYQRLGPVLGKQAQRNAERMIKTIKRGDQISKIFQFFVLHQWIYQSRNFKRLWDFLTPQERRTYMIDPADYDAKKFIIINNYGIQKYILNESTELLASNLLHLNQKDTYFSDIKWAYNTEIPFNRKKVITQMKTKILSSSRVIKAIQAQTLKKTQSGINVQKAKSKTLQEAQKIVEELVSEVKPAVIRMIAWTVHKAFKNMFEKININMDMLEELREIEKNSELPIVLLPTHRSYFDFLIVSYIFFIYKLRLPNFVADEVLLQAELLPFLVKSSGAFFFQRLLYAKSGLYRVVFDKYLELLLREGSTLQFFIEGSRSRTGKILAPKSEVLNVVLDTLLFGKVADVYLIPLTINYEKVLESDTFPGELLGEEKVAESLVRVIKASFIMRFNYGRVYVEICKPMTVRPFIEVVQQRHPQLKGQQLRRQLVGQLGKEIVLRLTNGIVIMSTSIVSSVLLMHRKGISEDALIKFVNELVKYILKKGYKVGGVNQNSSAVAVRNCIGYLSGITSKTKKNIFELTISAGDQFQKILMLSYYRNTLSHAFMPEAFVGCSLASFGQQLSLKQGVPLERVYEQTKFIVSLLRYEYNFKYPLDTIEQFTGLLKQLEDNQIVEIKQGKVTVHSLGVNMIAFFCSLLKAHIECYWASIVYIISISRNEEHKYEANSLSKFFDTVQWFMQSLYGEKVIEDYEACSLQSIKNSFSAYEQEKLIKITPGGKKKETVVEVLVSTQHLEGLENNIKFFRKNVYSSVLSPVEVAKNSLHHIPKL